MVLSNMSLNELRRLAEWCANFDRMQEARREIVRRVLTGKLVECEDGEIEGAEEDGYARGLKDGYSKGYEEARRKYVL